MTSLADTPFSQLVEHVGSSRPTPGAGPAMAWTCALAAALVEMVSAVALRTDPTDPDAAERRQARAAMLRDRSLRLADDDVTAYGAVIAVLRRRDEPGHPERLRKALSDAADPPLAIAELATELTHMAADAAQTARGAVRGEAVTAATLAEATVRAGTTLVALNLAGAPADSRRTRLDALAATAQAGLERALRA